MEQFQAFMANHPGLFAAAAAIVVLLIANEIKLAARGFKNVEPADAVRLINDGARILDLRSADVFRNGHIINAENVELEKLLQEPDKQLGKDDKPIITCCETGVTGSRAATRLAALAKGRVFNIKGGMTAWKRENLPVARN